MIFHLALPGVELQKNIIHKSYLDYINNWRENVRNNCEAGIIAATECLQGALVDIAIDGRLVFDWLSVMDDLLTFNNVPIAYSKEYSEKLSGFNNQYLQSTINAIHTRWWIERFIDSKKVEHDKFSSFILGKKQSNGLIYDAEISGTMLRHRMKTELTFSAALSIEILLFANSLSKNLCDELATNLCDLSKIPLLGYMSCEQYRLSALRYLSHEEQFPVGIGDYIESCSVGLEYGWNDFTIASKVDHYMGTAKRVSRDKAIHSPLVACHVSQLSGKIEDQVQRNEVQFRLKKYADYLAMNPNDIPAYQMRDIPVAFGSDITPLEAICASWLIQRFSSGDSK
jgi:hypothetical protein